MDVNSKHMSKFKKVPLEPKELPTWNEVADKYDSKKRLSPLEHFIYLYEPSDEVKAKRFRINLSKVLKDYDKQITGNFAA